MNKYNNRKKGSVELIQIAIKIVNKYNNKKMESKIG